MANMRIGFALIFVFVGLLLSNQAAARKMEDRDWIEVRSPNFVIHSSFDEAFARELALDLELFRSAVLLYTNIATSESTVPTRFYAIKNSRDLRKMGASHYTAGMFLQTMRGNHAVIRKSRGLTEKSTIQHEYGFTGLGWIVYWIWGKAAESFSVDGSADSARRLSGWSLLLMDMIENLLDDIGCVMDAMKRSRPPHSGHNSMSVSRRDLTVPISQTARVLESKCLELSAWIFDGYALMQRVRKWRVDKVARDGKVIS